MEPEGLQSSAAAGHGAPILGPGYTAGTVTDKISAIVLGQRRRRGWFFGFAISFALFIFGQIAQYSPDWISPVLSFLSMGNHFESLSRGVIDSRDVLYYTSVMVVALVIATASLQSRKWK